MNGTTTVLANIVFMKRDFIDYEDEVDCFIYIDLNPSLGAESLENFYNKTGGDDWFNNSGWLAGCSDTYD
jgi:hypothetical protein